MTSRSIIFLVSIFLAVANAVVNAETRAETKAKAETEMGAIEFVPESERGNFWKLESSDIPPRLGVYLRPNYSVEFEIEYTIESNGTVTDAAVVKTTDAALPNDLLMELIGSHRYRPGANNGDGKPIRTRMNFRLGAPEAGSEVKVCPQSVTEKSLCPK